VAVPPRANVVTSAHTLPSLGKQIQAWPHHDISETCYHSARSNGSYYDANDYRWIAGRDDPYPLSSEPDVLRRIGQTARAVLVAGASLAGPVPGAIATAIDGIFQGGASALMEQRVGNLLEDLRVEFVRIARKNVDLQFLQAQDFAHLVICAVRAAAKERVREKTRRYARILLSGLCPPWPQRPDRVEEVLQSFADVTESELTLLDALIAEQAAQEERGDKPRLTAQQITGKEPRLTAAGLQQERVPTMPLDWVLTYLARLQRLGFVLAEDPGFGGATLPNRPWALTPLLCDLRALLTQEDPPEE